MTHWYNTFWDPGISKKSHGFKPSGMQLKTHAGPTANEHDFRAQTACQLLESAIVLQKKIN